MRGSTVFDWNLDYLGGQTPWDTGEPAPELVRAVGLGLITPGRVFEMGCGSGQNAVFLAQAGFSVTAADCSSIALARARTLAVEANANVRFLAADVCDFRDEIEPVDLVLDRSCYEHVRLMDHQGEGYLKTLYRITRPGTKYLLIVRGLRKNPSGRACRAQILKELGDAFIMDDVASKKMEASEAALIRQAFLLTRRAAD